MANEDRGDEHEPGLSLTRGLWLALGFFCVGLGIIGALLPLMPTTIFLILAAGCFARSSPRFETWLLEHRHFGPTLRAWRESGAISRAGKIASCTGMALGFGLFMFGTHPRPLIAFPVALLLVACAAFVLTRPTSLG